MTDLTRRKTKALVGEVIVPDEAPETAVAVVDNSKALSSIAKTIRKEFGKGLDSQFAIGHSLIEARALLQDNIGFGKWLDEQAFPFSRVTAGRLREAAEREAEVRSFISERTASGGSDIGPVTAIARLNAAPKDEGNEELQAMGKRVQALFKDEPEPESGFAGWLAVTQALNLQTLTVEELGDLASAIKTLVEGYQAEKARRSA